MTRYEGSPLYNTLLKTGNFFFRWRSYLPLALLPIMVAKFQDLSTTFGNKYLDILYDTICLMISLLGEGIRILTVGHVVSGTSGRNVKSQVAARLNTTGMYSITRNPLYLGNYFIILGMTLSFRSWELFLIINLLFAMFYTPIILVEESYLLSKFKDEYESYIVKTPCFFPKFSLWRPYERSWNYKVAIRREYHGLTAVIFSFAIIAHLKLYAISGRFNISVSWLVIALVSLMAWTILKLITHKPLRAKVTSS